MADLSLNVNEIEIDEKKVKLLLSKLIMREKTNLQTREKSDPQMVQMIKKLIEEEVECY
jgi:hypothetical protein